MSASELTTIAAYRFVRRVIRFLPEDGEKMTNPHKQPARATEGLFQLCDRDSKIKTVFNMNKPLVIRLINQRRIELSLISKN